MATITKKLHLSSHIISAGAIIAMPGEHLTCTICIRKNDGVTLIPEIKYEAIAEEWANRKLTEAVADKVPHPAIAKDPSRQPMGLRMLERERKVRVIRATDATGIIAIEREDGTLQPIPTTVAFKGSEAAFAIWCQGNVLFITDKVERREKGKWNGNSFNGFKDLSVKVDLLTNTRGRTNRSPVSATHVLVGNIPASAVA